jgi:non-specific serine/threonine protein kinase
MTPERWEKIRELFHATFERSADDRSAYLTHACAADPSLRADVEKLISSHEAAPSFLERTETTLPAVEGLPLLEPEQRVGHYRILGPIGHGGMGVVYKAEDTRLGRLVALKFLPSTWAEEPQALERFRREARAASALNHPNVCTIHAIDEDEGRPFIAMELLSGETLAACIAGRPLATARLIELSVQIADGLQAAHEQGITHRDIKPGNIFVTDRGQAKILDFGLARMMTTSENTSERNPATTSSPADGGPSSLTQAGKVMGTVPYLSPEQLHGEQPDQRSDLFSFGTVMYEMATGKQAFSGSQETAVDAILNFQPPSPLLSNPQLPVELGRIIARALEKNRELRYQSAADLKADLLQISKSMELTEQSTSFIERRRGGHRWRWAWATLLLPFLFLLPPVQRKLQAWFVPPPVRLAVLPFEADAETTPLAFGMLHDISDVLASSHKKFLLIPFAETNGMYIGTLERAKSAANATHVLSGKMQRRVDTFEVSAAVIEVDSRRVVSDFTAQYRPTELGLAAKAITGSVAAGLHLGQPTRAEAVAQHAYPDYAQGLYYLRRDDMRNSQSADSAIGFFEKAIQLDPTSPLAYAGLARSQLLNYYRTKERQWLDLAQASVNQAEARNPDAVWVRWTAGQLKRALGSYDEAAKDYNRAIELDPKNVEAYLLLASLYEQMNNPAGVVATYRKAIEVQPSFYRPRLSLAYFYLGRRQDGEAEAEFREVIRFAPDLGQAHMGLGNVLMFRRQYPEAEAELRTALRLHVSSLDPQALFDMKFVWVNFHLLGMNYYLQQKYNEAIDFYKKAAQLAPNEASPWADLADAYRCVSQPLEVVMDTYRKAIELTEKRLNPQDGKSRARIASWQVLTDKTRALEEIRAALQLSPRSYFVQSRAALVYEQLGMREEALEAVKSAIELGDPVVEIQNWPPLKELRQDPRYAAIIEKKPKEGLSIPTSNK